MESCHCMIDFYTNQLELIHCIACWPLQGYYLEYILIRVYIPKPLITLNIIYLSVSLARSRTIFLYHNILCVWYSAWHNRSIRSWVNECVYSYILSLCFYTYEDRSPKESIGLLKVIQLIIGRTSRWPHVSYLPAQLVSHHIDMAQNMFAFFQIALKTHNIFSWIYVVVNLYSLEW